MFPVIPKTSHKLNPLSEKKVMGNEPRIFVARGFHFFFESVSEKKNIFFRFHPAIFFEIFFTF